MAYTREDSHTISGIGKKNGSVSMRETVKVSPDGRLLTQNFTIYSGDKVLVTGVAVFARTGD
jgi:hypothetical protein